MNQYEQTNIMIKALEHYGTDMQLLVAIEEMSELTKEIVKWQRKEKTFCTDMLSEIADVRIMLCQLEIIFEKYRRKENAPEVDVFMAEKLKRLEQRVESSKRN